MKYTYIDSPVGKLLVSRNESGITGLYMSTGTHAEQQPQEGWQRDAVAFDDVRTQLDEYWLRRRKTFDLPLSATGNTFQQRVWKALREVPYGETVSYGKLAAAIGHPEAARAVGTANAQNPICIIVPCHRVIGASGKLVGYAGGLEAKKYLLDLEAPEIELNLALFEAEERVSANQSV